MKNLDLFWVWVEFNPISFLPIAIGLKRGFAGNHHFDGTANIGYLEANKCHFVAKIEHLDCFWLESNPISFFVHCILYYLFTEHYCAVLKYTSRLWSMFGKVFKTLFIKSPLENFPKCKVLRYDCGYKMLHLWNSSQHFHLQNFVMYFLQFSNKIKPLDCTKSFLFVQ